MRRTRDGGREPRRFARRPPDLRARRAFQSHVADIISRHVATASVQLTCPACGHAVYAPADSVGERVDCAGCNAVLATWQSPSGVAVEVAAAETQIADEIAERAALYAPQDGWQERVIEQTRRDRR